MTWSAHDDARIRAWLGASAPERAPRTILEATFERTRSLPHASPRPRWREPRFGLLLAAALALAAIVGGAVIVALSPPPAPPVTLAEPRHLADFLWQGGYELDVDVPPADAVGTDAAVAAAAVVLYDAAPFVGPPDPPIFGRLRCVEPGLCGSGATMWPVAPDSGTTDTWSVWIVEYPQEEAYRIVSAWDGRMITGDDGVDLSSCSAEEVGTEPGCTAEMLEPPREWPSSVDFALGVWGQTIPYVEHTYTSPGGDNEHTWPIDGLDPLAIAATLVDGWETIDAYQGAIACQRAACPAGVVTAPGAQRMVVVVVVDDGARWFMVDAETGEVLKTDESPVDP